MGKRTTRHTPGPWMFEHDGMLGETFVGPALQFDRKNPQVGTVVATIEAGDDGNARLISAAPDLLAALKNLHAKALRGELRELGDLNEAEAAIAKAEGK